MKYILKTLYNKVFEKEKGFPVYTLELIVVQNFRKKRKNPIIILN